MQLIDNQPVFAATDLVGFLACEYLTALERAAMKDLVKRPNRSDPELDVIRKRGIQHEERYLAELRADGLSVASIERRDDEDRGDQLRRQTAETIEHMRAGVDVIYQATFFDGRWLGYADFLLRVDDPERASVWGPYHYEVADTKLARHVKAGAILQVCSYVEQLERIQGVRPREMRIVLGGSARETATLRVDDYFAYYLMAKQRFEAVVLGTPAQPVIAPVYPMPHASEPVQHCGVCRWAELCEQRRREDDHLSLVAGITSHQRRALVAAGIETMTTLANAPAPLTLNGLSTASLERIHDQARLQVQGRGIKPPLHELILPKPGGPIEPERGIASLPEPDDGDLFFDIEGDPYAYDDGLDYLFGVLDLAGEFTAFWSRDPAGSGDITPAGEQAAFERLMDFFTHRLERFPNMHIYHYAPYEPTALKRLMGRYGTRESQVDRLLRGGVLVDLFRAVRQGVRASVESYSIKKIEPIYGFTRAIELRDATSSIVEFETWLELSDTDRPQSDILQKIEDYNRDDVVSTLQLRDWLEVQRGELARLTGQAVPRPAPLSPEAPSSLSEADARVQQVADALTAGVPADVAESTTSATPEQHARWLLAQLLSFHRREAKVAFWNFFHLMDMTADELVDNNDALGRLELVSLGEPWRQGKTGGFYRTATYRFPPQEHELNDHSELYDPERRQASPEAPWKAWKLPVKYLGVNDAERTVQLGWPAKDEPRHPVSIVPLNLFQDGVMRESLLRLGQWVADNGIDAPGAWRAGRDLVLRRPPRCGQPDGVPLKVPGEPDVDSACRLVTSLQDGVLAIQGPPGSGKTYTGARMIVALVRAGRKVGITSNSHKVIGNLICEVLRAAELTPVRVIQRVTEEEQGVVDDRVKVFTDPGKMRAAVDDGEWDVAAGTAWLWSREDAAGAVDVLFVDEAGQVALANVLAMSGAARSIVLLGDPQQLDQPLQGAHPPGSGRSTLGHLLDDRATMPEDLGLFLEDTRRLHPDITTFTSKAFYEDRLESFAGLERQRVDGGPLRGAGIRLLASAHVGEDNESPEEADQVAELVSAIIGGATWTKADGEECPIGWNDVLIVAPYNAQVGAIQQRLPLARVGTVDKFQGQEAPISIYSMTSSSAEDAPRGMNFLYSRNRLNVATSRARCVTAVVATPALLTVAARTPEQMRLANALCQFALMAAAESD
jgi:predicted RecB family nuclease